MTAEPRDPAPIKAPLSNEERILAAAIEAVLGVENGAGGARAVQPMLDRLPGPDRVQLSLLLQGLEYGAPLLSGRPGRFTRLSRERREEILRTWSESRIPPRRQAVTVLRAIASFGHYGREETWADVGYDGPWLGRNDVAVHPAPPIPSVSWNGDAGGVVAAGTIPDGAVLRTRVCVIGMGAGGATALARLARAGIPAIGIEAGDHATADDFTQRELEMLPLLYQEAGLRATADQAMGILQGRGLGGSTLHNTGLVVPPPDGILDRWREESGLPLEPEAAGRYATEAIETLAATRIPEADVNASNEALRRGCEVLGWRTRIPLHNRAVCSGCGYCMLGCAYNRKFNASLTMLPAAAAGGAKLVVQAEARRITGPAGARRVECRVAGDAERGAGRTFTVEAEAVVVAAGAVDTPALLKRSGLGNDRVGEGLRLHPAPLVGGTFPGTVAAWRGLPQSVLVEEFASFMRDGRGGFMILALAAWPGLAGTLVPGLGPEHRARMRALDRTATAAVLLHDEGAGRVGIARDGRPRVRYWPDRRDTVELRRGIEALARIYLAAGADAVHLPLAGAPPAETEGALQRILVRHWDPRPHRLTLNSVHPQGSCALGSDARTSATDPFGELWGERGITVADASLFPGSVGVPPQVTVMMLAAMATDRLIAERL
jgi:choline dehydrogenase-like flavoprotein